MSYALVLNLLVVGLIVGTVGFAAIWGGRAERIGAAIYGLGATISLSADAVSLSLLGHTYPLAAFTQNDEMLDACAKAVSLRGKSMALVAENMNSRN